MLLNTHNYRNISFYINDKSGFFHQYYSMALFSQNNFNNFYDNINSTQFKQITNGKINYIANSIIKKKELKVSFYFLMKY